MKKTCDKCNHKDKIIQNALYKFGIELLEIGAEKVFIDGEKLRKQPR